MALSHWCLLALLFLPKTLTWNVQFLNCSLCFSLPLTSHPHSDLFWNDIARSKSWLPPVIKVMAKSDKNHIWSFKTLAEIPRRYKTTTSIHPSAHFLSLIWQTGLKECSKKQKEPDRCYDLILLIHFQLFSSYHSIYISKLHLVNSICSLLFSPS